MQSKLPSIFRMTLRHSRQLLSPPCRKSTGVESAPTAADLRKVVCTGSATFGTAIGARRNSEAAQRASGSLIAARPGMLNVVLEAAAESTTKARGDGSVASIRMIVRLVCVRADDDVSRVARASTPR